MIDAGNCVDVIQVGPGRLKFDLDPDNCLMRLELIEGDSAASASKRELIE